MSAPESDGPGRPDTLQADAMGLSEVVMQALTHIAPAGGAIVTMQVIVGLVGPLTPVAFLIAFAITMMLAITLTQLAKHLPSAGGYYTYVSRTVGPKSGFLTAWLYFLYDPIQAGMNLAFAGWFLDRILTGFYGVSVPWAWPAVLVAGTLGVAWLMYRGISLSGKALLALGVFEVVVFLALGLTGFVEPGPGGAPPSAMTIGAIPAEGSLFLAVVFSIFAFVGFEACVPLAEEAKDPRRTVPRAIILSTVIGGLFYVVVSWGIVAGWGVSDLGAFADSDQNPIFVVATRLWGGLSVLIVLVYLNSILAAVLSGNNAATRVFFAMARSGAMPRALGRVHPHTRAPVNAITFQSVITLVFGAGMSLLLGPDQQLFLWATVITLGLILVYIAGNVGVVRYYLTERRTEFNWLLHAVLPVGSSVALLVVGYLSIVPLPSWPVLLAPFITGGWLLLGVVLLAVMHLSGRGDWLTRAGSALEAPEREEVVHDGRG